MIAVKANEVRDNFKSICDLVSGGETVIIPRPNNKNVVFLSEEEFNIREKAFRNAKYMTNLNDSMNQLEEGNTVSFSLEELEAIENMSPEETQAFILKKQEGSKK